MQGDATFKFRDKLHGVTKMVDLARGETGSHYDFGREIAPAVYLVRAEAAGTPVAFSLWTSPVDVVEICGDAAVPATAGLLAIDRDQAHELLRGGVFVDLSQFTRSDLVPGLYYVVFDAVVPEQVHRVLHRVVPSLEPDDGRLAA